MGGWLDWGGMLPGEGDKGAGVTPPQAPGIPRRHAEALGTGQAPGRAGNGGGSVASAAVTAIFPEPGRRVQGEAGRSAGPLPPGRLAARGARRVPVTVARPVTAPRGGQLSPRRSHSAPVAPGSQIKPSHRGPGVGGGVGAGARKGRGPWVRRLMTATPGSLPAPAQAANT